MLAIVCSANDFCRKERAHGLVGLVIASETGGPTSSLLHHVSMQPVCQVTTCAFTLLFHVVNIAVGLLH